MDTTLAAEATNRFTALEAAQNEVTREDLWKGTKTVPQEVARETIGSVKLQKKKKWISDETYAAIREKCMELEAANSKGNSRQLLQIVKSMTRKICSRLQGIQSASGENLTEAAQIADRWKGYCCLLYTSPSPRD